MKRIVVSMLLLLIMNVAFAQMYVRVNLGYNVPMNSGLLNIDTDYNGSNGQYTVTGVYGSYGSGFSAHAAFGGGFGSGILGYDIEAGYLMGKKYEVINHTVSGNYVSDWTYTKQSKSIQFAPAITFTAGTGSFHPFARLGPVIGITSIKDRTEWDASNSPHSVEEYKYSGGIAFGFKGVVGVAYTLNDLMDLYAEIDFISMSYTAKKRKLEEFSEDGEDRMEDVPEERREEDLEKEYELGGEEYTPPVREPLPMGSLGIQLGLKIKL
jgi:hypothetical protein